MGQCYIEQTQALGELCFGAALGLGNRRDTFSDACADRQGLATQALPRCGLGDQGDARHEAHRGSHLAIAYQIRVVDLDQTRYTLA